MSNYILGIISGLCISGLLFLFSKRYNVGNKIANKLEQVVSKKATIVFTEDPVDKLADILEKERQHENN